MGVTVGKNRGGTDREGREKEKEDGKTTKGAETAKILTGSIISLLGAN